MFPGRWAYNMDREEGVISGGRGTDYGMVCVSSSVPIIFSGLKPRAVGKSIYKELQGHYSE